MKALVFDGTLSVREVPTPVPGPDEVLIRVRRAGICNTDHEIVAGYMPGFRGVLGHEFVGDVVRCADPALLGRRVTAEINCACGNCVYCFRGMERHCPERTVLGIAGRDGVFAEYVVVPRPNVVIVPQGASDTEAVFIEPLAAACEILEQVDVPIDDEALVLGDGKLGLLVAFVLQIAGCKVVLAGHHECKLAIAAAEGIETLRAEQLGRRRFRLVVEAAGSPAAFAAALAAVKPRGTLVLKSTYAGSVALPAATVVVNEVMLVGSRCGRFSDALPFLEGSAMPLARMVTAEYPLDRALEAFEHSRRPDALKVLLTPGGDSGAIV